MPIPLEARPFVLQVLEGVSRIVGDVVMNVAREQNPELDERPVADAGAEMDEARAEALRRAAEQTKPGSP